MNRSLRKGQCRELRKEKINRVRPALFACHCFPYSNFGHGSSYDGRNLPDLLHQQIELIREQRLRTIRQGLIRAIMHFHHESVGSDGNCRAREWSNLVALAGAMAGINQDRQMAQSLHRGNQAQI